MAAAYLDHRESAEAENEPERFFLNVVLAASSSPTPWSPHLASRPAGCTASRPTSATRGSA
ncbi:hypothetical protein [Lentzea guizhouensis]|uniref:hypothetical protein n=1 Tax=Lentzea guizhouensis TaxID=1586287 RepID=UPI001C54E1EB|nr:hypothetical protein [Lentzea guizhouensis]